MPKRLPSTALFGTNSNILWRRCLLLLSLAIVLSGCWYDTGEGSARAPPKLEKVSVTPVAVQLWPVSTSSQLSAVGTSLQGDQVANAPSATWVSENTSVATVDNKGRVTAVATGSTAIVVTIATVSSRVVVVVGPTTSVTGTIRYQDKMYNRERFVDTAIPTYKAVRYAKVDLVDGAGAVLKTTQTDEQGAYLFSLVPFASDHKIRVMAESDSISGMDVKVRDDSSAVYAVSRSLSIIGATTTLTVDVPLLNSPAGAFNIYDSLISASQFAHTLSGANSPVLSVFWEGGVASGTQYCTGYDATYCVHGAGIYVNSERFGDTDEFDDDVLWHEFGHFLVDKNSRDDSEGGCHFLQSTDLDMRLAWSEGWGDFFSMAVKRWLVADSRRAGLLSSTADVPASTYIDTDGGVVKILLDVANVSSQYSYATNEVSIAKILWDMSNEFQMAPLWTVMAQDFKLRPTTSPINLEALWDGWRNQFNPSVIDVGLMRAILRARLVYYEEDVMEPDDSPNPARLITIGSDEKHTLYRDNGSVDKDVVAINAIGGKSYTVETLDLRNGADTQLRILTPQQVPLMLNGVAVQNDDFDARLYNSYDSSCGEFRVRNTPTALASKTTFVAPVSGTYYVEVSTTQDLPPYASAGNYGSYRLRIIQQ